MQVQLVQAGQVLAGRVQDPLRAVQGAPQRLEVLDRHRVDQDRADAGAADLDEVGAPRVAETRGAFGVDGDGTGTGAEPLGRPGEVGRRLDERGIPSRLGQEFGFWFGLGIVHLFKVRPGSLPPLLARRPSDRYTPERALSHGSGVAHRSDRGP
ncbi:hypothetical protein GCM10029992_31200 [Glycomyces albus]